LGSRRSSELLVLEGRVSINGKLIKELGTLVADGDNVTVDGKPARAETGIVIALNKPRGYICSRSDEKDRMTIYALLPKPLQTLHHVGRLDKDSEGLLLLTNRGDLSHHLIHPSKGAEKEYEVIVDKPVDQSVMARLVKGMLTEEGYAKAERAWMISEYRCHVVLKQGLKRQIRLMFYQLGCEVERLTRTRIGWLELKGLQKGGWKQLTSTEVERFFSAEGTTGRAPRVDKPKVAKPEGEDDAEVIRPTRGKGKPERSTGRPTRVRAVKPHLVREERPFREPRGPGKGRSSGKQSPSREAESAPTQEERPAARGRPVPREERPASRGRSGGKARPTREGRSDKSGRPPARGGRSFDKARSTSREDGPRGGSGRPSGKRPASKRSGGPRRRD